MLDASDIPWTVEPLPAVDPLTMNDDDVLIEALRDGESYRLLAQVATTRQHDVELEHGRLRDQHHRLLAEYRALCGRVAA